MSGAPSHPHPPAPGTYAATRRYNLLMRTFDFCLFFALWASGAPSPRWPEDISIRRSSRSSSSGQRSRGPKLMNHTSTAEPPCRPSRIQTRTALITASLRKTPSPRKTLTATDLQKLSSGPRMPLLMSMVLGNGVSYGVINSTSESNIYGSR